MPRRAVPGHRDRLEAMLPPDLRDALERLREILNVQDWRLTPLFPPFAAAAAVELAIDLTRDGMAPSTALDAAADRLGIERPTLRSWLRRWPAASRGWVHNARAGRLQTPVALISQGAEALPDAGTQ